jgi:Cu-Zn family superoxide dismutase
MFLSVPVQTGRSSTTGMEGDAMKRTVFLACLLLVTGNLAYAANEGNWKSAEAEIKDSRGQSVGSAVFTPTPQGVVLVVEVSKLAPGKHGIHVHAAGICEPPEFKTAGGHFNPHAKKHGLKSPEGAHTGDLPNLDVGPNEKGKLTATLSNATLGVGDTASLLGPNGSSIVIHAKADDEMTDPSGNSGDRIACGVILGKR